MVPFLLSLAEQERWLVAISAVNALATIGSPASLDALHGLSSKGMWTSVRLMLPWKMPGARRVVAQRKESADAPPH
jgi:hypothetical protein